MALLGTCLPVLATEGTLDGFAPPQDISFTHWPGADQEIDSTPGILAGSTYLFVAGSAFTPRTSSQTVSYPGGGCSYSDGALTTSLELPEQAEVHGVRVYYYSPSPPARVALFLTIYPGNGSSTDLMMSSTSYGGGYTTEYFPTLSPLMIDNASGSYVLTATMEPGTRVCGMRVFYAP